MPDHWHYQGHDAVHRERECQGARQAKLEYEHEHPVQVDTHSWTCRHDAPCADQLSGCKICNPDP